MYFKLEKTYTKTDSQDWSGIVIDSTRALNPSVDERDNDNKKTMTTDERLNKSTGFRDARTSLGNTYVGWDREYVGNNELVLTYMLTTLESAKNLYIHLHKTHDMYDVKWKLTSPTGKEIFTIP